ncbi:MAG: hydroxyethylthiazole kinase [Pseudomonadota bacterium]
MSTDDIIPAAARALAHLRERRPRVHVITNSVVQGFAANMLLAAGAVPSMTIAAAEIADFAASADALAVNLGTLDKERERAIDGAVELVLDTGTPWLLDPVFVHVSPLRCAYAAKLARREPAVVRGNGDELTALIAALEDREPTPDSSTLRASTIALSTLATAVETGAVDVVSDGVRTIGVSNGHPYLAQVTGSGCAGGALNAAFLAVEPDRLVAAAASLFLMGIAAENAATASDGPGSFAWRLLDAIHQVSPADLARRAALVANPSP